MLVENPAAHHKDLLDPSAQWWWLVRCVSMQPELLWQETCSHEKTFSTMSPTAPKLAYPNTHFCHSHCRGHLTPAPGHNFCSSGSHTWPCTSCRAFCTGPHHSWSASLWSVCCAVMWCSMYYVMMGMSMRLLFSTVDVKHIFEVRYSYWWFTLTRSFSISFFLAS